jgi:nodulation protein E
VVAVHGHMMGATGAVELTIALQVVQSGSLQPTAHLMRPDPGLNLDFVPMPRAMGVAF